MPLEKKIKFAVVGCGRIGKRHASILKEDKSTELVAIVETDSTKYENLKNEFLVPIYNSINEVTEVDVVCICTPNHLHIENAIEAVNKLDCHIVCEKPMGLTAADCQQLIDVANQKQKRVFCVMQNRFSPPSKWLKSVIEQKLLGDIFQIQVNCFWNRENDYFTSSNWKGDQKKDGGPLYTQFSHFIDTLYWLFGSLEITNTKKSNYKLTKPIIDFEDTGSFQFKTIENVTGTFNYSIALFKQNFESSITIIGEKGTIKVGGQYMNEVEYCNIENYIMPKLEKMQPPNNYGNYKGSAANHHFVFQNVVDVLNGNAQIATSGNDGKNVVEIIEQVYQFK